MAAKFSNFDPFGLVDDNRKDNPVFNAGDAKATYSFNAESFVQSAKAAKEAAERMRAATCRCGHVGAECFNDSYCDDEPPKVSYGSMSINELCGGVENQCNSLDSLLRNANDEIEAMRDTINDLQADYAGDCVAWCSMYNAVIDFEGHNDDQDRIEQLETTIRVLSGMIE